MAAHVPYRTVNDVLAILDGTAGPSSNGSGGGKKRRRITDEDPEERCLTFAKTASFVLTAGPAPASAAAASAQGKGVEEEAADDGDSAVVAEATTKVEDGAKSTEEEEKTSGEDRGEPQSSTSAHTDTDAAAAAAATTTSASAIDAKARRVEAIRAQIAKVRAENEVITKRRKDAFARHTNLLSVYNYGLSYVATLNDLGGAPDNFLPGNHPDL